MIALSKPQERKFIKKENQSKSRLDNTSVMLVLRSLDGGIIVEILS
jgi:hypothetical protein